MRGQLIGSRAGKPEAIVKRVGHDGLRPDFTLSGGSVAQGWGAGTPAAHPPQSQGEPKAAAIGGGAGVVTRSDVLSLFHGNNSVSRANLLKSPALVLIDSYPDGSFSGTASMRRGKGNTETESAWSLLTDAEREAESAVRGARSSVKMLRKKVRHYDLRRLLTFTNGGRGQGWNSLRDAVRDTLAWYKAEGRYLLGDTAFVCVPERGGLYGRIHVHGAIRAGYRLDYSAVIASWSRFLTSLGYISSASCHRWHAGDDNGKHSSGFSSARVCANYMAKYLAKGFETEPHVLYEKRFRSEGCVIPEPRRVGGFPLADVPALLEDTFGGRVTGGWHEDEHGAYGGWWFEVDPP
jgi:hypothetical protein